MACYRDSLWSHIYSLDLVSFLVLVQMSANSTCKHFMHGQFFDSYHFLILLCYTVLSIIGMQLHFIIHNYFPKKIISIKFMGCLWLHTFIHKIYALLYMFWYGMVEWFVLTPSPHHIQIIATFSIWIFLQSFPLESFINTFFSSFDHHQMPLF